MKSAFLLMIAACASTPVAPRSTVREADETEMANCKPVGKFEGMSAQPGETGMEQARDEARRKATAAGASHIVVEKEWQSPDAASSTVKGYDCK